MQETFELIRKVHIKFRNSKPIKLDSFCEPQYYAVFNLDRTEAV
jgi:hypothetical protein